MAKLTYERAHEILTYCPETGDIRWKVNRGKKCKAGKIAGDYYGNGYRRVSADYHDHLGHRLAWMMVHGQWPERQIDHINGDRADNRLSNLRLATPAENRQNCGQRSDNTSGFKGVSWCNAARKWRAGITVNRKALYLGNFETREAAAAAYASAKADLHKFQPVERT